ncbi:MAG: lternative complex III protein ActF [Chlorobi bacterium OLB4]|jgi:hypothetical protein|nr:MAG: lternative complex III protein ActF [Chlorobi bacterium OLB4]MBW7855107.1 quinol:cytochrome C oxidoreductase [Ignavibacteria bacterium]OQY76706.1 MAG: quinol:cytochrome C oxidoreductase [Ignavibacteriales bacterium UTCHB1]
MEFHNKALPGKVSRIGFGLLITGLILMVAAFALDYRRAMFDYLTMFMWLLSLGLGSLGLIALEYISGATWSTPFRRVSEFLASLLPVMFLLVIPVVVGMKELFVWTDPQVVKSDAVLQGKEPYLNTTFFIARAAICLLIWVVFYFFLVRNSQKQDSESIPQYTKSNIRLSAIFTPIFMVTLTIIAIDFMMSLFPHWYSTIYGVYYFSGTLVAAYSALTLISVLLKEGNYLSSRINNDHFYSMGMLMFAFNIFWAYIAFSQLLLQWYADIPEETFWYIIIWEHSWKVVSIALFLVHFAIPFLVLMPRSVKTNLKKLKFMAIWMLVAHYLDLYWLIMPAYDHHSAVFGWQEIGFPLFAVGVVVVIFKMKARKTNIIPVGDPKLESGFNFHL